MPEATRLGLLLYCPLDYGGIAEYTHHQARALHELGVRVCVLASQNYLQGRSVTYTVDRSLPNTPVGPIGLKRRLKHALWLVACPWKLAFTVWRTRPRSVLLASYSEYLSPLWFWPHLLLRDQLGVIYGANLHDPVRDFRQGPEWWHQLSVRLAFSILNYVIVHEAELPPGTVPQGIAVHTAPHGIYDLGVQDPTASPPPNRGRFDRVLLCFGHVRDNKNIDLLIRALPAFPDLHLVVTGPPPSTGQRPPAFYIQLAEEMGVANRFRIETKFVPDEEVQFHFAQANWVAVTYARTFRSQSGVLSLAVKARKQVLASSGRSPLRSAVEQYGLGVFVEPDSLPAVIQGLRHLIENPPVPDWTAYEAYASWHTNALVVLAASGVATMKH